MVRPSRNIGIEDLDEERVAARVSLAILKDEGADRFSIERVENRIAQLTKQIDSHRLRRP